MRLIDAELLEEQFGISDADILAKEEIRYAPTVDAVVVTRCKDCAHSTLPSELTQRYGKQGLLGRCCDGSAVCRGHFADDHAPAGRLGL